MKEKHILESKKYFLLLGGLLLLFNNGATEIELHYENIELGEREDSNETKYKD